MPKEITQIELSKMLTIEIDDDLNVIGCICNWDTDNDDISIYSEEISVVLDGKEQNADMIEIWNEEGEVDTVFYIVHLFASILIPSQKKRKNSVNKTGDWCYILFSKENFDTEKCNKLRNNTATVDINRLITCGYIKYANIKFSEFLQTENANYIRNPFKPVTPRDPRYDWKS